MGEEQWQFSCNQNFEIGDRVSWEQMEAQIIKKRIVLKDHALEMTYEAGGKEAYLLEGENTNIKTLTLEGTAFSTEGEMIKIALDIDVKSEGEESSLYGFPYKPESGNVFYSMPEPGTRVCLYFPDSCEAHGYVIHSKRTELEFYPHPKEKGFVSSYKKALKMYPDGIDIAGEYGDTANDMSLSGREGIRFHSGKNIQLIAEGDIRIQSNRTCIAKGGQQTWLGQWETDNYIEMSGNDMLYSAEKYTVASPMQNGKPKVNVQKKVETNLSGSLLDFAVGGIPSGTGNSLQNAVLGGIPGSVANGNKRNIYAAVGKSIRR